MLPWKKCYYCGGHSYSAATVYDHWTCPKCGRDLTASPECDRPLRVIPGRGGEPATTPPGWDAPARWNRALSPAFPPSRPRRLHLVRPR